MAAALLSLAVLDEIIFHYVLGSPLLPGETLCKVTENKEMVL